MALQPEIEEWARRVLDWVIAAHGAAEFEQCDVLLAGISVRVSSPKKLSLTFTKALYQSQTESDVATWILVSNDLPGALWESSPIRYGDIDGRGSVAGSEMGDLAVAWNSGQFILTIMDRRTRVVAYVKQGDFHPSEIGGPLRTPLHWLVSETGATLLHAAAVVKDDKAVLIGGPSGAGKSTFALGALESGLPIIGDDYVILRDAVTHSQVFSSYRTVKSIGGQHNLDAGPSIDLHNGKQAILLDSTMQIEQAPLHAIAILDKDGPVTAELTDRAAATRVLSASTILQVPMYASQILSTTALAAERVPCYRIGWLNSPGAIRQAVETMVKT